MVSSENRKREKTTGRRVGNPGEFTISSAVAYGNVSLHENPRFRNEMFPSRTNL